MDYLDCGSALLCCHVTFSARDTVTSPIFIYHMAKKEGGGGGGRMARILRPATKNLQSIPEAFLSVSQFFALFLALLFIFIGLVGRGGGGVCLGSL